MHLFHVLLSAESLTVVNAPAFVTLVLQDTRTSSHLFSCFYLFLTNLYTTLNHIACSELAGQEHK